MDSVVAAYRILIFLLPLLYACHSVDFNNKLFQRYGTQAGLNASSLVLNGDNLTRLASDIVNGLHYNPKASLCQDVSTCSNQCFAPFSANLSDEDHIRVDQFVDMCPRMLYSLTQDCIKSSAKPLEESRKKSHAQPPALSGEKSYNHHVWGFGFLFVTLINLCSLAGIFVLPLMKKEFYSTLLMFLIALAVGSLSANGILVLIPEAFQIIEMEGYIWRACCVLGGVYLFFVTERLLKITTDYCAKKRREKSRNDSPDNNVGSIPIHTYLEVDRTAQNPNYKLYEKKNDMNRDQLSDSASSSEVLADSEGDRIYEHNDKTNKAKQAATLSSTDISVSEQQHGHSHHGNRPVSTVAWMIIFGDAFHNFIDGLSIGAAFSDSILLGVSICIAVLCEELPHELGDFAILLNAGMSKKRALLFNFLSACTCYLGLIIGISLAEIGNATTWILGLAGGMFLYISLADMMPEMNHAAEENKDKPFKVFFVQNLGLLAGFVVIFLVTKFGGEINLAG